MSLKRASYCFMVLAGLTFGTWLWARLGSFDTAGTVGQNLFAAEVRHSQLHLLWMYAPEADLSERPYKGGEILQYRWAGAHTVLWLREPAPAEAERPLVIRSLQADGKYVASGPYLASTDRAFALSWPYGYFSFVKGNIENETIPDNAYGRLTLLQFIVHPLHALLFLSLIFFGLYGRAIVHHYRNRRKVYACRGCGYDVRASLDEGRCPECGRSISDEQRRTIEESHTRLSTEENV